MKTKKHIRLTLFFVLILLITGCINNKSKSKGPLSRTEFLMDTVMTIKIYDKQNKKILDKAFNRLKEIEDRMSATINTSDVSKINENAGIKPVTVNPDTYFVIKKAMHYAEISSGAYDPTIGPLADLWNIKAEEKTRESIPSTKDIEEKKALVNYKDLEILDNNQVFLKEKNMKLVLGSIVKGYAADEVSRLLTENGVNAAIIDLGGNLFAHGIKTDGANWRIGIQDPFEFTGNYIGIIEASNKSIVTSGIYERFFEYKGKRYHHIIDTKTGYPVDNELTGISIISDRSIDGDALSTTVFALGLDKGMELINSLEGVEGIFVTKDKLVYMSPGIKDKFTLKDGKSSFTIKEY